MNANVVLVIIQVSCSYLLSSLDELDSEDYADELPEVVEEEATASQVPHDCFLHVDTDVPLTNQQ